MNSKEIQVGQKLYYVGLGYGMETHCYEIIAVDGIRVVHANNGVKRREFDVINNVCDLYSSKESANEILSKSWRATMLP